MVPPEKEAVNAALDLAEPGDIVALLYTDHDEVWIQLTARASKTDQHPR